MVKKVFVFVMGLLLAAGAMAQMGPSNSTISQDSIRFWTGSGSNRAVVAITWNDETAGNIGVAWGVQWEGSNVLIRDIMDTIATYDSNLTVVWNGTHTWVNNLAYTNETLGLDLIGLEDDDSVAWFFYNWRDVNDNNKQSGGVMGDTIANGDFVDWIPMHPETYESYAADLMIFAEDPNAPVDPLPEEATIAASEIVYWVGEGENEVVLAVNWADTALAWGYRFASDSVTVQQVMNDIMAADNRFSYQTNDRGYLDDIFFVRAAGDTLRKVQYSYWETKHNGMGGDAGLYQNLGNGDLEKWAEPAAGVVIDSFSYEWEGVTYWSYIYVYPMTIHAVSAPLAIDEVTIVNVQVYPNPVATVLNVRFDAMEQSSEAALYDMTGRRVSSMAVAAGSDSVQVPVSQLAEGVYVLRIGDAAAKVVVRR